MQTYKYTQIHISIIPESEIRYRASHHCTNDFHEINSARYYGRRLWRNIVTFKSNLTVWLDRNPETLLENSPKSRLLIRRSHIRSVMAQSFARQKQFGHFGRVMEFCFVKKKCVKKTLRLRRLRKINPRQKQEKEGKPEGRIAVEDENVWETEERIYGKRGKEGPLLLAKVFTLLWVLNLFLTLHRAISLKACLIKIPGMRGFEWSYMDRYPLSRDKYRWEGQRKKNREKKEIEDWMKGDKRLRENFKNISSRVTYLIITILIWCIYDNNNYIIMNK